VSADVDALDLAQLGRSLRAEGHAPFDPPEWLRASWQEPARFWAALAAAHDVGGATALRSVVGRGYYLFHDLVLRHRALATPALVSDGPRGAEALSFGALAEAAGRRAAAWREAGAQTGEVVALVRSLDRELWISLAAALHLGLVLALVPPEGQSLARARLAALGPVLVDVDPLHAALVPADARLLPDGRSGGGDGGPERAHAYQPGQPVALLFDPAGPSPLAPRPLACDAAWAGALRDGTIALGLRRGDALAQPGGSLLSTQPALVFASLMSGATFVHLTLDELARAPERLLERPLAALGVSEPLRELLRKDPVPLGGYCRTWFRDPLEAPRLEPWQAFIESNGLRATPALNLRWDAALGGATLASPQRIGRAHAEVLPAAGVAWSLTDLVDETAPATGGVGRFALTPPGHEGPAPTAAILVPHGRGWQAAGAMPHLPRGRRYPADAAIAAARQPGSARAATVLIDPSPAGDPPRVVLLAFGTEGRLAPGALLEQLALELGPELLPDEIACLPLLPRRDDVGAPDARWCHHQHRSGGLARKSNDELFLLLSRLRARVVSPSEEPR
jgi:hypothetical protein